MANYSKHFSTLSTPQMEKAREDQVQNNAGGFVFQLDKWKKLDRWLILGSEGGTYYCSEKKMTKDNAQTVIECLKEDGKRTIDTIVEISDSGRAPKNDPAIFALAMAAGDQNPETRAYAMQNLGKVCRIGTHLFHFTRDVEQFRRWGSGLRRGISNWYNNRPADKVAFDAVKYQQRDGWSHRDVLRLSHAAPKTPEHDAVFRYITSGADNFGMKEVTRKAGDVIRTARYSIDKSNLPRIITGFELAKAETDSAEVAKLVREYGLTREMVPTSALNSKEVWAALLEDMPLTAMVRNLGKMTNVGLLRPMSVESKIVCAALADAGKIKGARVHPLALLVALKIYEQGHGDKGSLSWVPDRSVLDALDEAFYLAFGNIVPMGKNTMLCLDVSGSMGSGNICGSPLCPRDGTAALSMATARVEKAGDWMVMGFSNKFVPLNISPKQRLEAVIRAISGLPFDGTDCALPMIWAQKNKIPIDQFLVFTDSETWAGAVQPFQALKSYRQAMGRNSKLVVCGMTATEFTIADPTDPNMLDVVGFDLAAPSLLSDFCRE